MAFKEYRITFGIEYDRHNRLMDSLAVSRELNPIRDNLIGQFGGYGEYRLWGGWQHPDGQTTQERAVCFSIFSDTPALCRHVAKDIGFRLNQHTVCLIHPGGEVDMIEIAYDD